MVCAIQAYDLGLKPIVLEKMSRPAGNTVFAGGVLLGFSRHKELKIPQNLSMTI